MQKLMIVLLTLAATLFGQADKSLGQVAYEAYAPNTPWVATSKEVKETWERVAFAVITRNSCTSTTLDGLPNCAKPKLTSQQCLKVFPPDSVGGFCSWYGYATKQEEDAFEKKRGFVRVKHFNGTGDSWLPDRRSRQRETQK